MAGNLPVVASKNSGHAEIICHGKKGYLVEQGDSEEMAKHIMELYGDTKLRD